MRIYNQPMLRAAIGGLCATLLLTLFSAPAMASSLRDAIKAAERDFGGEAFEAELYREDGDWYVDVELLSGNQIIEAEFLAEGSQLMDIDVYNNERKVNRAKRALKRAKISLSKAIRVAEKEVGSGQVREAELQIRRQADRSGRRFIVEMRDDGSWYDVVVNARSGKVVRVKRDRD